MENSSNTPNVSNASNTSNASNVSNASKTYSIQDEAKSLFDSPKMSDVRFLVDGQTLYGHKQVLGLGSPVFESLFFGDQRNEDELIQIEELTLVGFRNTLRYIYGFEIDFELSELYESYVAADKYLPHGFDEAFSGYIESQLSAKNSCLIYQQLAKIGDPEALAKVRAIIMENSKEAFESEHFTQIDQETLISLLSFDDLRIAEFDLFVTVSKWVDCELQRQDVPVDCENRRRVFEPIKGYIVFAAFSPEQIANSEEIAQLLTNEERGLLILHRLSEDSQLAIELKTSRKARSALASVDHSRTMYFSVNRRISITLLGTIYSEATYPESAAKLSLQIRDPMGLIVALKEESVLEDGYWSFSFEPPFSVKPKCLYRLQITGDEKLAKEHQLNSQYKFDFPKESVSLNFSSNSGDPDYSCQHFLRKVTFFRP